MEQDKNRKTEQKPKANAETPAASELLNSLKTELFDTELAEKYQKAQEAAQMFFALYTELQAIIDLQRWCNNKIVFKKCGDFKDYVPTRNKKKLVV